MSWHRHCKDPISCGRVVHSCGQLSTTSPQVQRFLPTPEFRRSEADRVRFLSKIYPDLLKTPGVARIIAAQLTARFPGGMLSLAYLLHIERIHRLLRRCRPRPRRHQRRPGHRRTTHQPVDGRLGHAPACSPSTTAVCAVSILTIAFVPMPVLLTMAVGFVGGLSYPPVQPAVRTIYPKMVNSRQLTPLFSLDASAQEIIWVARSGDHHASSPSRSRRCSQSCCARCSWSAADSGSSRRPSSDGCASRGPSARSARCSASPPVLLATHHRAPHGRLVRRGRGRGRRDVRRGRCPEAGIVLAVCAAGSLVGGLAFGHLPIGPWTLARRTFIIFVGMAWPRFRPRARGAERLVARRRAAHRRSRNRARAGRDVRDGRPRASSSATPPRPTAGSAPAS